MTTIGLIREGKMPPDARVALPPRLAARAAENFPVRILVQPSPKRCFPDEEYRKAGLVLEENISQCDILLGVKEVPIEQLIPEKTYLFFSHTIKMQPYNRKLLQAILEKNIRLIDYEVLTDQLGRRVIAFGRHAGMVGAHNAILTYGRRTGAYDLKRMRDCFDYAEAQTLYKALRLPPLRVVLTGGGRVASGAAEVLHDMGIRRVEPEEYLSRQYDHPVFTQLNCEHYAAANDGTAFNYEHFFAHPEAYHSIFGPYAGRSDIMINGIYWDKRAPAFFTKEEMRRSDFRIQVIGDVTCDIAPEASIPATLRPSTIADPIFGYDPQTGQETEPHREGVIDMMTIDNLPSELPRDASVSFGEQFLNNVLWPLLDKDHPMIRRATVAVGGELGPEFQYLQDYVEG